MTQSYGRYECLGGAIVEVQKRKDAANGAWGCIITTRDGERHGSWHRTKREAIDRFCTIVRDDADHRWFPGDDPPA